ncbi:hypothetical protein O6P43_011985 [Quillaja saponaria]|uniref:F-box protein n=1 Tax=Quillaja saponaria TaxID=32244 RepID=A0AAD7PTW7_QUISA|nr:hypothetical protein O6P43_011985 [Quillaja saponaria]
MQVVSEEKKINALEEEKTNALEEEKINNRKWDEMNHEIMVSTMKLLPRKELFITVCYVCKSWLSALLDSLFPPGDVLDLRLIDSIPNVKEEEYLRIRFRHYLKLVRDRRPPTQ